MKILFDTNVILDVMLLREPFYPVAAMLLSKVEKKSLDGFVCSTTVTTIYYLISKAKGSKKAIQLVENLLKLFQVSPVDKSILESALRNDFKDYEDAVLHESAFVAGVDGIVTRNSTDFRFSKLSVFVPEELLKIINSI